jgi:hypothetical protein
MAEATIALGEEVAALKPRAIDEFSRWAIEGAERALADGENPLRLNFFSTAMRILFEHMMETLSPPDQVILRTRQEIIESTFERVRYGFTTEYSYHMLWW